MAALRVRVLCDGCERTVADFYCSSCYAASCEKCKTKLHNGCQAFDIANSAAVLALCQTCRARPAHVRIFYLDTNARICIYTDILW